MILQDPSHPNRVLDALAALVTDPAVERLRVAVAYANPAGVEALHTMLSAIEAELDVEIVITLDMGITRKAALQTLLDGCGDVKVITTGSGIGTFHAKAFVVDRGDEPQRAILGSANLTYPALTRNYEAISAGDLTGEDAERWEQWWQDLTLAAQDLTPEIIAGYSERQPPPGRRERIADEDLETGEDGSLLAPAQTATTGQPADWLLIDWGGTGGYKDQLELPKDPAAFFSPPPTGSRPIVIRHAGTDYADNTLVFYPDNGMVRINLDGQIPVVADGSIKSRASLFTRLDSDLYELDLADDSIRTARLADAAQRGKVGYTTRTSDGSRRRFGWIEGA